MIRTARARQLSATLPLTMLDDMPTTADLLDAWRDATRAAELAKRLAEVAEAAAITAAADAAAVAEVATLAETAATAATEAAVKARATADRMQATANEASGKGRDDAATTVAHTSTEEAAARDRYHEAEADARRRLNGDRP